MFDAIVVGAGPAGSSAAYQLARKGCSVLILEQAALPRSKPCSGALSPLVSQWFDFDFAPIIEQHVRHIRYTWKLTDEVVGELQTQEPIWIVKRDEFDQFLVDQAIAQGAQLQDQTAVTGIELVGDRWVVQTSRDPVEGRYLIAADGTSGPLAAWLGFESPPLRQGAILTASLDRPPENTALNFEFGLLKNGCLWCFPQTSGYVMGAVSFLGKQSPDYTTPLHEYAESFGVHRDQTHVVHAPLKLWDGNRTLHTQRAVIVGEAGAIVDPLSAEGIRHGMYSGVKAAEAIYAALQGELDALASYTAAMHEWGNNIQWAQRIASVFFRVPGIGYRVGIKRPTMTTRMGQLLAGEIQYSDIANRILKRLSTGLIPGRK